MLEKQQLSDAIITGLPIALFAVDADFKIVEFNPATEKIIGKKRSEVLGLSCAEVFCSSLCKYNCPLKESRDTGQPCIGREAVIRGNNNKEELPIIFTSHAIKDESGVFIGGIEVFRDATNIRELEAHKHNLISLFTHDLKAPVAIIGGFVNRLQKGKAGELNEKQTDYLQIIQQEVSRLEQYIHTFLDIARIESGQIKLQPVSSDFGSLVEEIATGFQIQASKKQIELQLELTAAQPVMIDRLQISRVISNLLDNAIKYSPENSVVVLHEKKFRDHLILEIRDQGAGINIDDQGHVFDHFYRIEDKSRTVKGTGLGLAAVKAIVEAHSGRVWLHSIPGEGSSFFVSLPI